MTRPMGSWTWRMWQVAVHTDVKFNCSPDASATLVRVAGELPLQVRVTVLPFLSVIVERRLFALNANFVPSFDHRVNVVDFVSFASTPGGAIHVLPESRNVCTSPVLPQT